MTWRASRPLRAATALCFAIPLALQACIGTDEPPDPALVLVPADYGTLDGWAEDDHAAALAAFRRSCDALANRQETDPLDIAPVGGLVKHWRTVCAGAAEVAAGDTAARAFFEASFAVYEVRNNDEPTGLFTGYYEPELNGASAPDERFSVPLYARPDDLVAVDLGRFRDDFRGERIAGRVDGGVLVPYATRAQIDAGALAGKGHELVWVDDSNAAFFLHIQGSGRILFEDGSRRRVAYAATNGHAYFPIGRKLIEIGALTREEVSLPTILAWLEANPAAAPQLMRENRSYVFFRWLEDERATLGPVGAQGVPLSAGRSLAIDRRHIPLGVPLWVDGSAPAVDPALPDRPMKRLVIAQDTGGAIRGPVRGDVFWGTGAEAGAIAGRMKHAGRYWLLLPRDLDVSGYLD